MKHPRKAETMFSAISVIRRAAAALRIRVYLSDCTVVTVSLSKESNAARKTSICKYNSPCFNLQGHVMRSCPFLCLLVSGD